MSIETDPHASKRQVAESLKNPYTALYGWAFNSSAPQIEIMKKKNSNDVDAYIAQAPAWARSTLRELRKTIKAATPKAQEKISYRMPYYGYYGRLAYFAAFKNHCSFFWISSSDKKEFKKELARQNVVGSTLRIPRGAKVPAALIKRIVKARVKKNEEKRKT